MNRLRSAVIFHFTILRDVLNTTRCRAHSPALELTALAGRVLQGPKMLQEQIRSDIS